MKTNIYFSICFVLMTLISAGCEEETDLHFIGETWGGGIIFWLSPDGEHGLITSLKDLDSGNGIGWSNLTALEIGAAAQSSTNGVANTAAIISQSGHLISAAKICAEYTFEGFDDWYLPSERELHLLVSQDIQIDYILDNDEKSETRGFIQEISSIQPFYWSSTEARDIHARAFNFIGGSGITLEKRVNARVRAIRAF